MLSNSQQTQLTSRTQSAGTPERAAPVNHSLRERIALNQLTTLPWCLKSDLEEYGRYGIPAIGLNWRKVSQYGVQRAVRRVQNSRLPVSSLSSIGGFTGGNGYSTREVMDDARRVIRVAAQLRAGTVTVVTGPQAGHIRSHANRLVVQSLQELVPFAATYGVQLALQPMHSLFAKSWSFLHSLDDSIQILDRVGDSRLKLAFGTYHLWQEPQLLERLGAETSRIGLVRLADWGDVPRHDHDWLLPGAGRLPLTDVMWTLENHGYSGWYEVEVWSRDLWKLERCDLMRSCVLSCDTLSAEKSGC